MLNVAAGLDSVGLQDNGGPTFTIALAYGSPALNAGDNALASGASLTTDQRGTGFPRVVEGTVNIGAFEGSTPAPPPGPDTLITGTPGTLTKSTKPIFTFSGGPTGSNPVGYQVRIDGGSYTATLSPYTTPVLTDGSHTLEVRAIDAAGNVDPTPASFTFEVDTKAPVVNISAPSVSSVGPGGTVTFTITYTDPHFASSALAPKNVKLSKSGKAKGTVSVSGSGNTRTVTIENITGRGSLGITLTAHTVIDAVGNTAVGRGQSTKFFVHLS